MDDQAEDAGSAPGPGAPGEGWMLREDVVREVLARLARGEQVKAIARELYWPASWRPASLTFGPTAALR